MIAKAAPILPLTAEPIRDDEWQVCAPTVRHRTWDWCLQNLRAPDGTPFDGGAFPWLEGMMDAYDNPKYREIVMQWGSRLGKTFAAQACILKQMAVDPVPVLFSSSDESNSKDITRNKYYPMADHVPILRRQLPSEYRRSAESVDFSHARIKVAWSGSSSRLADYEAHIGHFNEIDKWTKNQSSEADPLELATERCKNVPDAKMFFESTPGLRGHSRVELRRLGGTDSRYFVPCPHCGEYQILKMSQIRWDKDDTGHSNPALAEHSARYHCEHCDAAIFDWHRPDMMRRGKWAAAGQKVEKSGAVSGTPKCDSDVWSSHLSSLYAASLTWGKIASAFVRASKSSDMLRNFVNSWLAETWEPRKSHSEPENVAERLRTDSPRGIIPPEGRYLVMAADRQAAEGEFFKISVLAIGENQTAWLVDYGLAYTLDELYADYFARLYPHADGGESVRPVFGVIDSGYEPQSIYDFCARHPGLLPCKGAGTDLGGAPYRVSVLNEIRRGAKRLTSNVTGTRLLFVNTDHWESELQSRLEKLRAGENGSLNLCQGASDDPEFLEDLCNAALADKVDARGNAKVLWVKRWPSTPNDFRDTIRYGLCAAKAWLDDRMGRMPERIKPRATIRKTAATQPIQRPDGRGWWE